MGHRRRTRRLVYSDSISGVSNGLLALALLAVGGFVVFLMVGKLKTHAEGDPSSSQQAKNPKKPGGAPSSGSSGTSKSGVPASSFPRVTPQAPAAPSPEGPLSVSVMAKEACRYSGDNGGRTKHENAAHHHFAQFRQAFRGQTEAPQHLEPYDEILAVDDIDLRKMSGPDAGSHLGKMLNKIPGGSTLKFRVNRNGLEQDVYVLFPLNTSIADARADLPGRIRIDSELALLIQKEVLALSPLELGDSEREIVTRCLGRGEATTDEYAVITRRLSRGVTETVRKDDATFKAKIDELVKLLPSAPVPDSVITKDGRHLHGTVANANDDPLVIETAFARLPIPKADVRFVFASTKLREEFGNKLASVEGENRSEVWSALLKWTQEWGLETHREYVAFRMLAMDPHDRVARLAAGFYDRDGMWVQGSARAVVSKKPQSREELRAQLEGAGFVLKDGKWFSRGTWSVAIDNLHAKSDVKMSQQGTAIMAGREGDTPLSRLFNPNAKPKPGEEIRERFIAPTGAQGVCTVSVEAPGEILECQVKAAGAVLERSRQGKLEVYIIPEGGKAKLLYLIEGAGNQEFHEVSAEVKGRKRFTVQARMATTVDKYHTYARFLPCVPETKEVFCVRARILQPAADIDRTWASMK